MYLIYANIIVVHHAVYKTKKKLKSSEKWIMRNDIARNNFFIIKEKKWIFLSEIIKKKQLNKSVKINLQLCNYEDIKGLTIKKKLKKK